MTSATVNVRTEDGVQARIVVYDPEANTIQVKHETKPYAVTPSMVRGLRNYGWLIVRGIDRSMDIPSHEMRRALVDLGLSDEGE